MDLESDQALDQESDQRVQDQSQSPGSRGSSPSYQDQPVCFGES